MISENDYHVLKELLSNPTDGELAEKFGDSVSARLGNLIGEKLVKWTNNRIDIDTFMTHHDGHVITDAGRNAIKDYETAAANKKRLEKKADRRYWITTIIAIFAILIAAIALLAQLDLIALPDLSTQQESTSAHNAPTDFRISRA